MADKKSFVVYNDYIDHFELLTNEERGSLIMLMLLYVNGRPYNILDYSATVRMAFSFIRADIDRNTDKYEQTCSNRSKAALKREENKRNTTDHKKHNCDDTDIDDDTVNETETYTVTDSVSVTDTGYALPPGEFSGACAPARKQDARSSFIPPTETEVREYCMEQGLGIDPQRFVDYYGSQKWKKANGQKISDWKAAARQWSRNEISQYKQDVREPPHILEEYDDDTLAMYGLSKNNPG